MRSVWQRVVAEAQAPLGRAVAVSLQARGARAWVWGQAGGCAVESAGICQGGTCTSLKHKGTCSSK